MDGKIRNRESGMSLLEVLVGMLVLSVGLLGLAPMLVVSVEGNVSSRDASAAANLAKEKVEYYEGLDVLPAMPVTLQEADLNGKFARITNIRGNATDSTVPAGAYRVDVQVAWLDNANVQRTTRYSTLILEP